MPMEVRTGLSRHEKWEASYRQDLYPVWVLKHPACWSLWLRRAMFLTLPISGPVWMAACILVTVLFWLSIIPIAIFNTTKGDLWDA